MDKRTGETVERCMEKQNPEKACFEKELNELMRSIEEFQKKDINAEQLRELITGGNHPFY